MPGSCAEIGAVLAANGAGSVFSQLIGGVLTCAALCAVAAAGQLALGPVIRRRSRQA
jgi:hypothetical protein